MHCFQSCCYNLANGQQNFGKFFWNHMLDLFKTIGICYVRVCAMVQSQCMLQKAKMYYFSLLPTPFRLGFTQVLHSTTPVRVPYPHSGPPTCPQLPPTTHHPQQQFYCTITSPDGCKWVYTQCNGIDDFKPRLKTGPGVQQ